MADGLTDSPPEKEHPEGGHIHNLFHHHHTPGQRLRKLFRPNGRRVHIASTPDEHYKLKEDLPKIEPDDNFDCYLHGSPEHLAAVREIHAHHEQEQHRLRSTHGDAYDDFEFVRAELDALAEELHNLTDHTVNLDANFSKYGYSAHIRTRDPDSSAGSVHSDRRSSTGEKRDWDAERTKGTAIRFYRRPVVRQYFHKGLLWRASEVEEVASFELFVDLLYVGIIAVIGDTAAEEPTGFGLLRFAITFILGWKMWSDLTLVISWFEIDDIIQRLCVLFVMITLFGFTLNIVQAFDSTWIMLVSFYLAQRLFHALYFLWIGWILPMVRGYMSLHIVCIVIPAALWIASIQVEYPRRLAVIWVAIAFDLFAMAIFIATKRFIERRHPDAGPSTYMARYFDFFPAINIEHKTERTGAFVTLVFGYSVVALLFQNRAEFGINAFFGKAVLGLIQAFSFNWLYFEIDACNLHTHAIRRHYLSAMAWMTLHLPFIMAYVLAGAALSRLVLATDCRDANVEDLTEMYVSKSEHEVSDGLRWFYCGGLGIALMSMSFISLSHVHRTFSGQRLSKTVRLVIRLAVAVILICLPLAKPHAIHAAEPAAPESTNTTSGTGVERRADEVAAAGVAEETVFRGGLSSLTLVATATGLVVLVLLVDLYGSTRRDEPFWKCRRQCGYSTECAMRRKTLVRMLKNGETINLSELQERQGEAGGGKAGGGVGHQAFENM